MLVCTSLQLFGGLPALIVVSCSTSRSRTIGPCSRITKVTVTPRAHPTGASSEGVLCCSPTGQGSPSTGIKWRAR
jgi:hypothetical protein